METTTTPGTPEPREARAALDHAEGIATSTRARGWRWVRIYLLGWAVASVGLVLVIGLGGQVGVIVGLAAWALIVTVGATWANRQGVMAVGAGRRIGVGAGLWAACYGAIIVIGTSTYPGEPWFWLPAAVLSAVPLAVVALLPAKAA